MFLRPLRSRARHPTKDRRTVHRFDLLAHRFSVSQDRMVKELRLAGVSSINAANAWLAGFIAAYNRRFGRDPANAKDQHRPLSPADDLDEILAWREERTVTHSLTLHYDRMMLLLDRRC